jgi:hypothetical protein
MGDEDQESLVMITTTVKKKCNNKAAVVSSRMDDTYNSMLTEKLINKILDKENDDVQMAQAKLS